MSIEIVPTGVPVGAEIRGVDLGSSVSDETLADIVDALHEHSAIVFRNQNLTEQQHVDLSRRVGPLRKPRPESHFLIPGFPDLTRLSNILEDGNPIGAVEAGQYWHTDRSFTAIPNGYAILYAIEVPRDESGRPLGDTMLASAKFAYASLPRVLKDLIAGRKATHFYMNPARTKDPAYASESDSLPPVDHPMVRIHPRTGAKCLYVNQQYTWKIPGMDEEEGRKLIDLLTGFITRSDLVYRHRWQEGDLLMWDDCSAQHCAVGDYRLPQRRLLRRTTVAGSAPL